MANRLLMPNDAVKQADVKRPDGTGRRYTGSIVTPADSHDERALREYGATPAGLGVWASSGGRTCGGCGFSSYFTTCSRCGGACSREDT